MLVSAKSASVISYSASLDCSSILAALLTVRMTIAVPILMVTFTGKLYEYLSLKVAVEESSADEAKPLFETSDPAILPIITRLKEDGGEYLNFGVCCQPIDKEQIKKVCEENSISNEKAEKITQTLSRKIITPPKFQRRFFLFTR